MRFLADTTLRGRDIEVIIGDKISHNEENDVIEVPAELFSNKIFISVYDNKGGQSNTIEAYVDEGIRQEIMSIQRQRNDESG